MSEDRDLNRKGRKDSWGHTGQPMLLGHIQQASSPGSKQIQLMPGSGTGSAQWSQPAQTSRAPSPHQFPSKGSPCQHSASSVIHSDAQLYFLFIFYIVDTPLVTPVRPSKETLRAWSKQPLPPFPTNSLPRDMAPGTQPPPAHLSISRAAMMTRHSEDRTTATTASAVVWSYVLGGCSTGSERPWHLSP